MTLPLEDIQMQEANDQRLMRRSRIRACVFFVMLGAILWMWFTFRGQPLFMFDFFAYDPDLTLRGRIFRYIVVFLLCAALLYLLWFSLYALGCGIWKKPPQGAAMDRFKKYYNAYDILSVIPLFLLCFIAINGWVLGFAYVDGTSMEPTYSENDFTIINHGFPSYEAGDVVIVNHGEKLIKRLIGLPGDHLVVAFDGVYINDELIESTVRMGYIPYDGAIPDGFYFVMGDNRAFSNDSRYFGLVPESMMMGEVIYPRR
jgi:signal peptidase I